MLYLASRSWMIPVSYLWRLRAGAHFKMNFSQGSSRSSQRYLCISYSSLWIHRTRWKWTIGTHWRTDKYCRWMGVYEQYNCQLNSKTRYQRSLLWPQVSFQPRPRIKFIVNGHWSKWTVHRPCWSRVNISLCSNPHYENIFDQYSRRFPPK